MSAVVRSWLKHFEEVYVNFLQKLMMKLTGRDANLDKWKSSPAENIRKHGAGKICHIKLNVLADFFHEFKSMLLYQIGRAHV